MTAPATVIDFPAPNMQELETRVTTWVDKARALVIHDDIAAQEADEMKAVIVDLRKEVYGKCNPVVRSTDKAHKDAVALFRGIDDPLAEAELIIKRGLGDYQMEQDRLALIERRRLEEEARKLEEAQRLDEAVAAEEAGDQGAAEEILARPIATPVIVIPTVKLAGSTFREVWHGEVESLMRLVCAIAGVEKLARPDLLCLITSDDSAVRKTASTQKSLAIGTIPGVRVWMTKDPVNKSR